MKLRTGLILALGLLASLASMQAAIIPCALTTTMASLIALGSGAGNGCQIDDKIYNNFSYTPLAGAPAAGSVNANLNDAPAILLSGWTFTSASGSFAGNFSLGFTVSVVTAGAGACPTCTITSATEQMLAGTVFGGPQGVTVAESAGTTNPVILTNTFGGQTGQDLIPGGVLSLTKMATTSGISTAFPLVSFESDIRQTNNIVPEPVTMSLMGAGLLGLGLLSRRIKKS